MASKSVVRRMLAGVAALMIVAACSGSSEPSGSLLYSATRTWSNGMVERVIRTLKEQCLHRHRFETQQHASRVIGDWIRFYNHRRPHQALGMKTPAKAYALAA